MLIFANVYHMVQRYGLGPDDELPLESAGDYTRNIGYLKFANYTVNVTEGSPYDNLLNNVWYQPEEVFPVDGTPEERQHAFWVAVDPYYYEISKQLEVNFLSVFFFFKFFLGLMSSFFFLQFI